MHYVYLLISEEDGHYIGCTRDPKRRLKEHNSGKSKYTKGSDWKLVYYEAYASASDACRRELRLKDDGRARYQLMKRVEESLKEVRGLK